MLKNFCTPNPFFPGTGEPGGLPSIGLHRVRHNWSDLAAAAATPFAFGLLTCKNERCNEIISQSVLAISFSDSKYILRRNSWPSPSLTFYLLPSFWIIVIVSIIHTISQIGHRVFFEISVSFNPIWISFLNLLQMIYMYFQ